MKVALGFKSRATGRWESQGLLQERGRRQGELNIEDSTIRIAGGFVVETEGDRERGVGRFSPLKVILK